MFSNSEEIAWKQSDFLCLKFLSMESVHYNEILRVGEKKLLFNCLKKRKSTFNK